MVTENQVRRLRKLSNTEKNQEIAASKAGMDPKTARKYLVLNRLPSEVKKERHWRTREDPFSEVWDQVNKKGGLYPSKYQGLKYAKGTNHAARRSQGQLIVADEKNVYVATNLSKTSDALTVLNAKTGEYVGSLDLGTFVSDMALVGGKIALATDDGLKLVQAL